MVSHLCTYRRESCLFHPGGVLSDCWRAEERGRAISIYSLAPLLGPAVGPIAGGFITENVSWRWAFWATSIADAIIQISGLFFLRETYPPKLLYRKAEKLRKQTGNTALHTEFEHPERSFANTMKRSLVRPFILLGTQPMVQALAIYMAYLYGLLVFSKPFLPFYIKVLGLGLFLVCLVSGRSLTPHRLLLPNFAFIHMFHLPRMVMLTF